MNHYILEWYFITGYLKLPVQQCLIFLNTAVFVWAIRSQRVRKNILKLHYILDIAVTLAKNYSTKFKGHSFLGRVREEGERSS